MDKPKFVDSGLGTSARRGGLGQRDGAKERVWVAGQGV